MLSLRCFIHYWVRILFWIPNLCPSWCLVPQHIIVKVNEFPVFVDAIVWYGVHLDASIVLHKSLMTKVSFVLLKSSDILLIAETINWLWNRDHTKILAFKGHKIMGNIEDATCKCPAWNFIQITLSSHVSNQKRPRSILYGIQEPCARQKGCLVLLIWTFTGQWLSRVIHFSSHATFVFAYVWFFLFPISLVLLQ